MTIPASRTALPRSFANASHSALLIARYLPEHDDQKKARRDLQNAAAKASHFARQLYDLAYDRWNNSIEVSGTIKDELSAHGRLIVGMGTENVLESGLTLHHTYGVPVIPGSALKGIAAHYAHSVWGTTNQEFKISGKTHDLVFGNSKQAGFVTFHDAWIHPDSLKMNEGIVLDVLTPHNGDYYGGNAAPTDFDSPNPISFLSVTGKFLAALTMEDCSEKGQTLLSLVMSLLKEALCEWGVGGKTSSGYGRFVSQELKSSSSATKQAAVHPPIPTPDSLAREIKAVRPEQLPSRVPELAKKISEHPSRDIQRELARYIRESLGKKRWKDSATKPWHGILEKLAE